MMVCSLINLVLSQRPSFPLSCQIARQAGARGPAALVRGWVPSSRDEARSCGTQAVTGEEEPLRLPTASLTQSFYFIKFSWNPVSQQACVCRPSATLTLLLLPTFYLHFTTFSTRPALLPSCDSSAYFHRAAPCMAVSKIHLQFSETV